MTQAQAVATRDGLPPPIADEVLAELHAAQEFELLSIRYEEMARQQPNAHYLNEAMRLRNRAAWGRARADRLRANQW